MPISILIVDNNHIYLGHAMDFLTRLGYRVFCATNEQEALDILRRHPIAVALLDVRLTPEEDEHDVAGLDLAKKAAAFEATLKIMITAHPSIKDIQIALGPWRGNRSPAAGYVDKADGFMVLAKAIERVLHRAKVHICYAPSDYAEALNLYTQLEELGFVPWMDNPDMPPGELRQTAIGRQIKDADCFVLLASRRSMRQPGIHHTELGLAWDIQNQLPEGGIFLLPVRLDDCQLPYALAPLHRVDLFQPNGLPALIKGIRTSLDRKLNQFIANDPHTQE